MWGKVGKWDFREKQAGRVVEKGGLMEREKVLIDEREGRLKWVK